MSIVCNARKTGGLSDLCEGGIAPQFLSALLVGESGVRNRTGDRQGIDRYGHWLPFNYKDEASRGRGVARQVSNRIQYAEIDIGDRRVKGRQLPGRSR